MMGTFAESIAERLKSGHYGSVLCDYCLHWRRHPTRYVIENVIRHLIDAGRANELYETLIDEEFRSAKIARISPNAFRSDLRSGLDFFSAQKPNLLRYLQMLFVDRRLGFEEPDRLILHERHCREYQDFLQLDVPSRLRRDIGVHKVVNQIFPIAFRIAGRRTIVSLQDYELGVWTCECGAASGQTKRHDYGCQCGSLFGNGLLPAPLLPCARCGTTPQYTVCVSCHKRVSLQLLWRARDGNLHPAELRLPIKLSLTLKSAGAAHEEQRELIMMQLPLPIGVREDKNGIQIAMPDLFWSSGDEGGARADYYGEETGGVSRLVTFLNRVEYFSQQGVRGALEAMLTEVLNVNDAKGAFRTGLRKTLQNPGRLFPFDKFSKQFIAEFISSKGMIGRFTVPSDFVRAVDHTVLCTVASAGVLNEDMCIVDHRVTRPGAFSALFVVGYVAFIYKDEDGTDELTVTPDGLCHPQLAEDGIVKIGSHVAPGGILVGIRTRRHENKYAQLLSSITGRSTSWRDVSVRLPAKVHGRILSVDVEADKHWLQNFKGHPARIVQRAGTERLNSGERARITVNVAVEHTLGPGDALYDDEGARGVVCEVAATSKMEKLSGAVGPDIIVSPKHPWSTEARRPLTLKAEELLGHTFDSRSFGPYSYESDSPMLRKKNWDAAATSEHFIWLLATGALEVAGELIAFHSDCRIWRGAFYEKVLTFDGEIPVPRLKLPRDLTWCPSESARHLAFLLRGLSIKATVMKGGPPSIRFGLLSADEVISDSSGEVNDPLDFSKPATLNRRSGTYSYENHLEELASCLCGKKSVGFCKRCGSQPVAGGYHRSSMRHVLLPEPMMHPLFVDAVSEEIGAKLSRDASEIKSVINCDRWLSVEDGEGRARFVQGVSAFEEFVNMSGGLSIPTGVKLRALTVVPENRRPCIQSGDLAVDSDLNCLYSRVVARSASFKRMVDLCAPSTLTTSQWKMTRDAVHALIDNENLAEPFHDANKRSFVSLKGKLTEFVGAEGTLLDTLLLRRLDYSGWTRLICGDCGGIDSMLLPEEIAWDLMEPLVMRILASDQGILLTEAKTLVQKRDELANKVLRVVCINSVVLMGLPHGPWPLVGLTPTLTSDLAVCIDSALIGRVGWQNLGEGVPLFMLLTPNAQSDARGRLMPSSLIVGQPTTDLSNRVRTEKRRSTFDIVRGNLVEQLLTRAYKRSVHSLSPFDLLAMGLPRSAHDALARL